MAPHRNVRARRATYLNGRVVIPVDAARRKFLIAFGVAFIGIGYSYMIATPDTPARHALAWIHLPFWLLGVAWVACGAIAVVASFVPTTRDKPGFLCLSVPPTLWAFAYGVAEMLDLLTRYDAPRAWVSCIVFAVVAFAVDTVSGMVDARLVKSRLEHA